MKVSPECFIQLCHRVSTLHSKRKKKEKFIESPGEKDREKLLRAQVKRDKETL